MKDTRSRITQKLMHRFFIIYTCVFALLMILILSASGALMLYSARKAASSDVALVSDTLSSFRENIYEKSYLLISMDRLEDMIVLYDTTPSQEHCEKINLCLSSFQAADSSLLYVMLEDEEKQRFHSGNYSSSGIEDYIRSQDAYRDCLDKNTTYLSPVLAEGFSQSSSPYCYFLIRQTLAGHSFLVTLCYDAQTLVQNIATGSQNLDEVQIYNSKGECLYDFPRKEFPASFPLFLEENPQPAGSTFDRSGYHCYQMDYSTSYYTVGTIHLSVLLRNLALIFIVLCAFYFIPLAAVLFYIIPVTDRQLRPIHELTDEVQNFSLGKSPTRLYETGDEIEDLSRSFQNMTLNINEQAHALSLKEREKAATYYKLLTTQLDPHFIYNTMNIINILARQQAFEDIVKVNTALTRVLRERLNTQNTTFDEIGNEIQALKQYQVIMDYRYHHQVQVEYDIDPSILTGKIPKNILQPLIENSYYHGLTRDDGTIAGTIGIVIYPMEDEIVMEISDDGKGFTPEHLREVQNNLRTAGKQSDGDAHIGMENIYQRIRYLYQENFSMDIQSSPGHGTTVVITLPLTPPM